MRYVIKIGTSSLFKKDGNVNEIVLTDLLRAVQKIFNEGHEVVIVVSGAIACGKKVLKQMVDKLEKDGHNYFIYKKIQEKINIAGKIKEKILEIENKGNTTNNELYIKCIELLKEANLTTIEKSILAGIGQIEMMRIIQTAAFSYGILTEQVLLSGKADLRRSTAKKNVEQCLRNKILPVVNANDTVYEEELADETNERFSDNDTLASGLARTIKADSLFLITNVDGYLDKNNNVVSEITIDRGNEFIRKTKLTTSLVGTGGMHSKLTNALAFARFGGIAYIISAKNISEIGKDQIKFGTKISSSRRKVNVFLRKIREDECPEFQF